MRPLAHLVVLGALSLLATSCTSGGQGEGDYINRVREGMAECGSSAASGETTFDAAKQVFIERTERFGDLDPPDEIEAAHNDLLDQLNEIRSVLEDADSRNDLPSEDELARLSTELDRRDEAWREKLQQVFGVVPFRFEGESMEPNIHHGESFLFQPFDGTANRWDVIVFEFPLDPERTFLKRVVGLPGETVEVRNDGAILINGAKLADDTYQLVAANYNFGPETVPEGAYFVLGDNRRNSFDSHAWGSSCAPEEECAFVPAEAILGELPPDTVGTDCRDDGAATPVEE